MLLVDYPALPDDPHLYIERADSVNSITIPFDKLYAFIWQTKRADLDYVTLTVLEPEVDSDGDKIPATWLLMLLPQVSQN